MKTAKKHENLENNLARKHKSTTKINKLLYVIMPYTKLFCFFNTHHWPSPASAIQIPPKPLLIENTYEEGWMLFFGFAIALFVITFI